MNDEKYSVEKLKILYEEFSKKEDTTQIYCNGCNQVVYTLNRDSLDQGEAEERFPDLDDDVEEFCENCCYPALDDENYLVDIMTNIDNYIWYDGVLEGHIEFMIE